MIQSVLKICLILVLCEASFCSFLLEELKSINYEVDISKTPVKMGEEQPHPTIQVKSKYGQDYQCNLPLVDEDEPPEKREVSPAEDIDVLELLAPLENNPCLLKTKDWWTYEFCSGQHVKQYHIEDGKVIGQIITLGLYESDYNWKNDTEEEQFRKVKQRYHHQTYTNGSKCDLTGIARNTEVRIYCEEDAGDYIYRVDEPGTCSYILTVHTARLCAHPKLKPQPINKAHLISCSPLLDEDQYLLYLNKMEEEKDLAEKKRSTWLTNQQERLKVMKDKESNTDVENSDVVSESSQEPIEAINIKSTEDATDSDSPSIEDFTERQAPMHLPNPTLSSDDDIEKLLLQEYDKEIEKLKSIIPSDKLANVKSDIQKEFATVRSDIQREFDSIINEAEDLDTDLDDEAQDAAFSKLAMTLNMLLSKLDKAEKDVVKDTDEVNDVASSKTSEANGDTDEETTVKDKNKEESTELKVVQTGQSQSAVLDDDKLHVRIRRLDRKTLDTSGELHEMDFAQRRKLEQAVKEKLEQSGLDTGGRRIEVKIITAGYYDNEDGRDFQTLSDEETSQFQNMIMALLTGQQDAIQEMERHKKLEENYKFVWTNGEQIKTVEDDE